MKIRVFNFWRYWLGWDDIELTLFRFRWTWDIDFRALRLDVFNFGIAIIFKDARGAGLRGCGNYDAYMMHI
jgi:hypothetical protein